MVKFALSNNESLRSPLGSTKVFTHAECDNKIQKLDSGKFFCLTCMKTGWPVRKAPKKKSP